MLFSKPNKEILKKLNKTVYGHESVKKLLITMLSRQKFRYYQKFLRADEDYDIVDKLNCLLVGGSGTGKTYMLYELAKITNFNFIYVDATKLNPTGASGGVKDNDLRDMLISSATTYARDDRTLAYTTEGGLAQTVVFMDEVDKLAKSFEGSGNWNKHVQSNFLTLIDDKEEFGDVCWVFAGAFDGMEIREGKDGFGFTGEKQEAEQLTDQHVLDYGLLPELVGRCGVVSGLDVFDADDYYNILQMYLLPKKRKDLAHFGVFFDECSEETLRKIAEKASKNQEGVRGLRKLLEIEFLEQEFNSEPIIYKHTLTTGGDDV